MNSPWNQMANTQSTGARGYGAVDQAFVDESLRSYMLKVYNLMASGLLLSGIVAVFAAQTGFTKAMVGSPLGLIVMLAPIGFLLVMSFGINKISAPTIGLLYWAFVAVNGLSISTIFLRYGLGDIARVFFITAATFGAMSLWGYTTKRDLTGMGSFLLMGLIGIMIASLVNLFMQSAMMQWVISVVGVLIFTGLTAYDTQRIKSEFAESDAEDITQKKSIMGAVALYLDFLNIFMLLLNLFGGNKSND